MNQTLSGESSKHINLCEKDLLEKRKTSAKIMDSKIYDTLHQRESNGRLAFYFMKYTLKET